MTTESPAHLTMAAASGWTAVADALPPDGEVVDTISPGGLRQTLQRQGRLWFDPPGVMYVYYQPQFWRPTESTR